jgi:hypothetical protein
MGREGLNGMSEVGSFQKQDSPHHTTSFGLTLPNPSCSLKERERIALVNHVVSLLKENQYLSDGAIPPPSVEAVAKILSRSVYAALPSDDSGDSPTHCLFFYSDLPPFFLKVGELT